MCQAEILCSLLGYVARVYISSTWRYPYSCVCTCVSEKALYMYMCVMCPYLCLEFVCN